MRSLDEALRQNGRCSHRVVAGAVLERSLELQEKGFGEERGIRTESSLGAAQDVRMKAMAPSPSFRSRKDERKPDCLRVYKLLAGGQEG